MFILGDYEERNPSWDYCAARHIGNRTYRRHGLHFFPWKGAGGGMPWKESSVMDERIRFVIRLKDGESMAALCREFQISRKTGYKIFERYEECGLEGLTDRARRPHRYANQLPEQIEAAIVAAKREKPHWGARKIQERLLRRLPSEVKVPARSTIHAILDRHGLVARSKRSGRAPKALRCPRAPARMPCGVLTTRESSCSPIGATVIR